MWESGGPFRTALAAELALLDDAVRRNPRSVRALLHPDFVEIGRSGRLWTRDEMVASLEMEQGRARPELDEWKFNEVAPNLVLVTYRVTTLSASSRHASLWDISETTPRLRYHQGTPLPSDVDE